MAGTDGAAGAAGQGRTGAAARSGEPGEPYDLGDPPGRCDPPAWFDDDLLDQDEPAWVTALRTCTPSTAPGTSVPADLAPWAARSSTAASGAAPDSAAPDRTAPDSEALGSTVSGSAAPGTADPWAATSATLDPDPVGAGAAADALSRVRPGADLLTVLLGMDPDVTDDAVVVEAVAAWSRMSSWVHAQAAGWAQVLSARESMNPVWSDAAGGAPAQSSVAGDELAMRLAVSRRSATALVTEGCAYAGPLVATGDALSAGRIDPARARLLVDRLGPLPLPVALAVEDRVLPGAAARTVGQLRRDVERALVEVDGAEAATRHRRARARRRVEHPRLLPDGMAGMWCVLPAGDAARVDGVLDVTARAGRAAGDPRTLDQLRADVLRDLVVHHRRSPDPGSAPTGSPRSETSADHPDVERTSPRVEVQVTVPLSTLLGLDDGPGHIAGLGPVDAVQARALAAGGLWRRIVTDPLTGAVLDVGRTRYRPTAAMVAHVRARDVRCARPGCDVDARRADLDHTVEFHPPPGTSGTAHVTGGPSSGTAGTSGGTRRTSTSTSSTAPDRQPPRADEPGTGSTAVPNLGPLCRRDHRLKTDGGYTLRQPSPGLFEWTTPTGHTYRLRPGTDRAYQHGAGAADQHPTDSTGTGTHDTGRHEPRSTDQQGVDGTDEHGADSTDQHRTGTGDERPRRSAAGPAIDPAPGPAIGPASGTAPAPGRREDDDPPPF